MEFNIFSQLFKELYEFDHDTVHIAESSKSEGARYLDKKSKGYDFSQKETLNTIELYYNSKFGSGSTDSEGQRKVFLNICQFRADVAAKQVDLDVKNFVFIPDEYASVWGAYLVGKRFRKWAKDNYFGDLINEVVSDYPKYGTVVLKKVGNRLERVPLMTLRNQQDAKDLQTARYVIEEHKDMTLDEMVEMPNWDTSGLTLKYGEKETVYERYGRVPLSFYKKYANEKYKSGYDLEGEDNGETVDCMAILTLAESKDPKDCGGTILFLEKITSRPYVEVHWKRQDGRWLGIGEIENQFENQIFRNMVANMRRRGLLWSSKKIFQTSDPEVSKNLVRDVKDGDVLVFNSPSTGITQVNNATQNLSEFQAAEQEWEKNSDQKSFTYEVATGENMPSGTPFRLGVILSSAVNSHFELKREKLGLFFVRVVTELVYPIFKKQNKKEHTVGLFANEEGVEELKQVLIKVTVNKEIKKQLLNGILPDVEAINQKVTQEISTRRNIFMLMEEGFIETVKATATLVITGEQVDVPKRIETLTSLYTSMVQRNDPRADKVLGRVLALAGENYDLVAGAAPNMSGFQQPQPDTNTVAQLMSQLNNKVPVPA